MGCGASAGRAAALYLPAGAPEAITAVAAPVAEAPWSVAEWAVALRFDNPRATVLVLFFGLTVLGFQTPETPLDTAQPVYSKSIRSTSKRSLISVLPLSPPTGSICTLKASLLCHGEREGAHSYFLSEEVQKTV